MNIEVDSKQLKGGLTMITYSQKARDSYVEQISKLQKELANIPTNLIDHSDLYWLINVALYDLKKTVIREHLHEDERVLATLRRILKDD